MIRPSTYAGSEVSILKANIQVSDRLDGIRFWPGDGGRDADGQGGSAVELDRESAGDIDPVRQPDCAIGRGMPVIERRIDVDFDGRRQCGYKTFRPVPE